MKMYEVFAENHSHASENRIHNDDIAQKYGFRGGLVPGVAVFGYMTHPLVTELGEAWLGHSMLNVRFQKPAYEGDRLHIELATRGDVHAVTCRNDNDELLAELSLTMPTTLPEPDPRFRLQPPAVRAPRVEITASAIALGVPFMPFRQAPTAEDNIAYAERVGDDLELYRHGVLHPHLLQHWSNLALVQRFVMPAWIHVGSEMRFRKTLHVGDSVEIRAVPLEKWERKGHEFVKLYVAYVVNGEPATEVYHTAIYRVATKAG